MKEKKKLNKYLVMKERIFHFQMRIDIKEGMIGIY
jgi:hypothetical protein